MVNLKEEGHTFVTDGVDVIRIALCCRDDQVLQGWPKSRDVSRGTNVTASTVSSGV